MTSLALALALALATAGTAPALDVKAYRTALDGIAARLDSGDPVGAAELASPLMGQEVAWEGEELLPDPALLESIARGDGARVRAGLDALRAALDERTSDAATGTAEARAALERLSRDVETRQSWTTLPGMPGVELPWRERIGRWLASAMHWIGGRLVAFLRWLESWWGPSERPLAAPGSSAVLIPAVLVVVGIVALLLVVLAVLAIARRRGAPVEQSAPPPAASGDADPTSRDEPAWRARAEALAAEGRHREAIRALYHALLVRCFETGVLQPRRGTTNREYARTLDARVAWGRDFDELTLRFDLEWYGHEASTAEAFAEFASRVEAVFGRVRRAEAA